METQCTAIADAIEAAGWHIESRESGDWWWEIEVWHLRSTWAPREAKCVLTFMAPPEPDASRASGWGVNVVASRDRLAHNSAAGTCRLYLGRSWRDGLDAFVAALEPLRRTAV